MFEGIRNFFSTKKVVEPKLHKGFTRSAPETDDTEMLSAEPQDSIKKPHDINLDSPISGLLLCLTYKDARGNESERDVECRKIERKGNITYLHALCFVREAPRTFRVDRISEITDYRTGEVFENTQKFFSIFSTEFTSRPSKKSNNLRTELDILEDGLTVLSFFCWCDDDFSVEEEDVVEEYIEDRILDEAPHLMDKLDMDALLLWVRNLRPDPLRAERAIVRIAENVGELSDLFDVIYELVEADGQVTQDEVESLRAFTEIVKKLAQ